MSKKQIPMFIGNRAMTVVDAMEKIDKNARGILKRKFSKRIKS